MNNNEAKAANDAPDNRKHHTVSVCYLRPWQDRAGEKGQIELERVEGGKVVGKFKIKPRQVLYRNGYYDMSSNLNPLPKVPASLLETDIFAKAMEPAFAKTRSKTLDVGRLPTLSQAAFLAEFCLTLYYRSPRFQRMADQFVDHQDGNEFEKRVTKQHGARTLTLTIAGAIEITRHCVFNVVEAVGKQRFWTSDVPCWMWHRDGLEWTPTHDIVDLRRKALLGVTATRWLCPLTPKYLLEICPTSEQTQVLQHLRCADSQTQGYNDAILRVADRFRIAPPG